MASRLRTRLKEAKLTCVKLNSQMPCPPRGTVPVNQECRLSSFTHDVLFAFGNDCDPSSYVKFSLNHFDLPSNILAGEAPPGSSSGDGANPQTANAVNSTTNNVDKPARLYAASYIKSDAGDYEGHTDRSDTGQWQVNKRTRITTINWTEASGGEGHSKWDDKITGNIEPDSQIFYWADADWPAGSDVGDVTEAWSDVGDGIETGSFDYTVGLPVIWEHCRAAGTESGTWTDVYEHFDLKLTGVRNAQAVIRLQTGGKVLSKRQNLFCLHATARAQQYGPVNDDGYDTFEVMDGGPAIEASAITIMDKKLGSDGKLWVVLPDNADIDVTPLVKGLDCYSFAEDQQKYKLRILANDYPLADDRVRPGAKHAIGEKINLSPVFIPGLPEQPQEAVKWVLAADYINAFTVWLLDGNNHPTPYNNSEGGYDSAYGLTDFGINTDRLQWTNTFAWWRTGSTTDFETKNVSLAIGLTFNNGQSVIVTAKGLLGMHQPTVSFNTASYQAGVVHGRMLGAYPASVLQCRVGSYEDETDRIEFTATSSSLRQGKFAVTQLIIRDSAVPTDTFTDWRLDNSFPYTDDPDHYHSVLTNAPEIEILGTANLSFSDGPSCVIGGYMWDHFDQFFMYRPTTQQRVGAMATPGTFLPGSIWVTLGKANWEWKGKMKYFNLPYGWDWDSDDGPSHYCTHSQSIQSSTKLPEWNNRKSNNQ